MAFSFIVIVDLFESYSTQMSITTGVALGNINSSIPKARNGMTPRAVRQEIGAV